MKIPYLFGSAFLTILACLFYAFVAMSESACSTTQLQEAQVVGSSLIQDVAQGTIVASDAFAVYQSVNQNLTAANVTTGKLSVAKVIAGGQAITQTLGSPATASLTKAATDLVSDVNDQIASYKAAGITAPSAITPAVSQQAAAAITQIANNPVPTAMLKIHSDIRPPHGSIRRESAYDLSVAKQ